MKKIATITRNKKCYRISSYSQTVDGFWIALPPFVKLDLNIEPKILVENLLDVLSLSKINVPHPKDWEAFNQEMLKNMEVKSLTDMYKDSIECNISIKGELFTFLPTKRYGNKGRFDHLNNLEIKIPVTSANEEIYEALQQALNRCE
jgi:hypothetical protein